MTKEEMVQDIVKRSGLTEKIAPRQMEVAYDRFMAKSKEFVYLAYSMVKEGKVTPVFAMSVGTGIVFNEPK